jgi:hypothetical protein
VNYQERESIFSKEILNIEDVCCLFEVAYSTAATLIRDWKLKLRGKGKILRVNIDGKIHILDYFEFMEIDPYDPGDRYFRPKPKNTEQEEAILKSARKSICC